MNRRHGQKYRTYETDLHLPRNYTRLLIRHQVSAPIQSKSFIIINCLRSTRWSDTRDIHHRTVLPGPAVVMWHAIAANGACEFNCLEFLLQLQLLIRSIYTCFFCFLFKLHKIHGTRVVGVSPCPSGTLTHAVLFLLDSKSIQNRAKIQFSIIVTISSVNVIPTNTTPFLSEWISTKRPVGSCATTSVFYAQTATGFVIPEMYILPFYFRRWKLITTIHASILSSHTPNNTHTVNRILCTN